MFMNTDVFTESHKSIKNNYRREGPTTDWVSHPLKGWSRCKVVCCEGVRVPSNAAWSLGVAVGACRRLVCSRLCA